MMLYNQRVDEAERTERYRTERARKDAEDVAALIIERDALAKEVADQKNIIVALQTSAQGVEHDRGVDGCVMDGLKELLDEVIAARVVTWDLDRRIQEAVK